MVLAVVRGFVAEDVMNYLSYSVLFYENPLGYELETILKLDENYVTDCCIFYCFLFWRAVSNLLIRLLAEDAG